MCFASAAWAETYQVPLICTDTGAPVNVATLDVVKTAYTSPLGVALTKIDVYIADWLTMSDDKLITSCDGKFSTLDTLNPMPNDGLVMYTSSTLWMGRTTMLQDPETEEWGPRPAPASYLSFTTKIDNATWERAALAGATSPATGMNMYTNFSGGWYSGSDVDWVGVRTNPAGNGRPFTTAYVTAGGDFTFTCTGAPHGIGTQGGTFGIVKFDTSVPEPGTIMLLATGLMGLLCYAWRKRK